eukprot:15482789-Alexandrium_andersonii.AAC.1
MRMRAPPIRLAECSCFATARCRLAECSCFATARCRLAQCYCMCRARSDPASHHIDIDTKCQCSVGGRGQISWGLGWLEEGWR